MNKTKIKLTSVLVILSVLISVNILVSVSIWADNNKNIHSPKAKERMDMVKKMKMIEAMELDEAKSEKFLLKFNVFNKRVEENRKQQHELIFKLSDAVKNNNSNLIAQLTNQVLNLQEEFNKINSEKTNELRGILSETEFAKYLVFENKFINEVFSCFMNHNHKGGKDKLEEPKHKNKR